MSEKKIPRILAIYLPQYYENEDNNRWWGKGFTDWESVRAAEKYFPEHNEPRVPLNENYYDLSQYETMKNQAILAKKYGIGGFCFYHYYFKDGKKELELPAENLLKWKDIDMPFCFNWASESWIRSWSKIEGNVWAEKYEKEDNEIKNGVLALQDYGDETAWKTHFEYLLPFFQDSRYIKIEEKPVFIFYSPNDIGPLSAMVKCWRKLAQDAGFPGLYLIGAHMNAVSDCLDAAIIYEPRNAINCLNVKGETIIKNGVRCFSYKKIWEEIVNTNPIYGYKTYFCGVSGYDDTPRRGRCGESLIGSTPTIFKDGMTRLIQNSMAYGNEFVFVNAWNEWGEGMYLEPDETDGYGYLETIKPAIQSVLTDSVYRKDFLVDDRIAEELKRLDYNSRKFKRLFNILDKWLFIEQENKTDFKKFFSSEKIKSVAIYGMAAIGKHLLIQLQKENVDVIFGIDQYVGQYGNDFNIYRPEDNFPEVDAIIVTAYDTESIKEKMRKKYKGKILSIEEIIDVMMKG